MAQPSLFGILFVLVLGVLDGLIIWKCNTIVKITGWKTMWSWFVTSVIIGLVGILLAVGIAFIPNSDSQSMIPGIVWFVSVASSSVLLLIFVYKFSVTFQKQFGKK